MHFCMGVKSCRPWVLTSQYMAASCCEPKNCLWIFKSQQTDLPTSIGNHVSQQQNNQSYPKLLMIHVKRSSDPILSQLTGTSSQWLHIALSTDSRENRWWEANKDLDRGNSSLPGGMVGHGRDRNRTICRKAELQWTWKNNEQHNYEWAKQESQLSWLENCFVLNELGWPTLLEEI